jgi:hypothetical protein
MGRGVREGSGIELGVEQILPEKLLQLLTFTLL